MSFIKITESSTKLQQFFNVNLIQKIQFQKPTGSRIYFINNQFVDVLENATEIIEMIKLNEAERKKNRWNIEDDFE
ncbi:MAG: hypothetical protein JSS98_02090 [Bacteroidetes bacterium]|nr:hypothetical protein [Bacteroidota bacterium]